MKDAEKYKTGIFKAVKRPPRKSSLHYKLLEKLDPPFRFVGKNRKKILWVFGIMAALGTGGTALQTYFNSKGYITSKAQSLLQEGDEESLRELMPKLLRLKDLTNEERLLKIKCKLALGEVTDANTFTEEIYRHNQSNHKLIKELFDIYEEADKLEDLKAIMDRNVDIGVEGNSYMKTIFIAYYYEMGKAHEEQRDYKTAREYYRKAVDMGHKESLNGLRRTLGKW